MWVRFLGRERIPHALGVAKNIKNKKNQIPQVEDCPPDSNLFFFTEVQLIDNVVLISAV